MELKHCHCNLCVVADLREGISGALEALAVGLLGSREARLMCSASAAPASQRPRPPLQLCGELVLVALDARGGLIVGLGINNGPRKFH